MASAGTLASAASSLLLKASKNLSSMAASSTTTTTMIPGGSTDFVDYPDTVAGGADAGEDDSYLSQ
jgi:hypothetical protein